MKEIKDTSPAKADESLPAPPQDPVSHSEAEDDVKTKEIRIKPEHRYNGRKFIEEREPARINKEENLDDELGIFRLASVHSDLYLANQAPNTVLVNLKIKFITKADREVSHVIPVAVTLGEEEQALTYYSGATILEKEQGLEFSKFYKSVVPSISEINRRDHYHSEPFLAYYLCSKDGKNFLLREFEKKGLIIVGEDGEHYKSDIKQVIGVGLDLHSTKVVCYHCGPFLKAATPRILSSIYYALALGALPRGKRLSEIEFNVSANQNFDWENIAGTVFGHIPVLEDEESNILSNTEESLGSPEVRLQKVGEASNRTYFLSGSYAIGDDVIALRSQDEKEWEATTAYASTQIQKMWRGFSERKKSKRKPDEIDPSLAHAAGAAPPVAPVSAGAAPDPDGIMPQTYAASHIVAPGVAARHPSGIGVRKQRERDDGGERGGRGGFGGAGAF